MGDSIPDEILSEILSPALRVSDAAFAATFETVSPFLSTSESSSAFLLVSKSFLRVATPLLYNVVVLRSKAQAQALAGVLTSNPALGKFIRKLRLEVGGAISVLKILQNSPNISDIFISLDIEAPDNACGLCRGLHLIEPTRIILFGGGGGSRHQNLFPQGHKLVKKLEKCLPTWTKLTVVELHYRIVPLRMSYMTWGGMSEIARALSRAPNLATLVVSNQESFLTSIRLISPNTALKRIRIKSFDSLSEAERRRYIRAVKQLSNRMYELFDFPDEWPSSDDAPPPFVYPPRLAADAVQEDAIWSRVLYFALQLAPRRLSLLLVSKKFARLGIPHLYASPTLFQDLQLRSFAVRLSQHPFLGRHVRRITISHRDDSDVNLLRTIIAHTPFLVGFFGGSRCSPIPWLTFDQLGYSSGSTLSSFEDIPILKDSTPVSPAVFNLFPQMRYFGWNSPIVFKTGAKWIPRHTFNNLVRLTVATFDPSFLEVLSRMELPSLRTASFSATADGGLPFFLKHGKKLEHLTVSVHQIADPDLAIFQSCPSISVLGISCDEKTILSTDGFNPPDKHMCLERIVFMLTDYPAMKQPQRNSLIRFLTSLDVTRFPALRQIEHPHCEWPTTDLAISRSSWVRWAESLLERNIQLVDSEGTHWRPRLKYVPNKTK